MLKKLFIIVEKTTINYYVLLASMGAMFQAFQWIQIRFRIPVLMTKNFKFYSWKKLQFFILFYFFIIFHILRYTYIHLMTFIQHICPSPFAEVSLHLFIALKLSGKTSLWCRVENRTRACLTASRRSTNWAPPHHKVTIFCMKMPWLFSPLWRTFKPQEKPLDPPPPAKGNIQHLNIKFLHFLFCGSFLAS